MPIDTHAHYFPPSMIDAIEAEAARYGVSVLRTPPACQCALAFEFGLKLRPFFPKLIEPTAARLSAMDRCGIDRQVLSTWADVFAYQLPRDKAVAWHAKLNETMAALVAEHPERFSFIASLPLPYAAEAAEELARATRELGAVGAVVAANVDDVSLGEVALDELWSAAVALDAGVLIHPAFPQQGGRAGRYGLATIAQYTYDTTLTVGSLIFAGVLDRFPKLRLLLCHGGGTFPYLAGRFDIMHARTDRKALGNVAAHAPSHYLPRFYYDTILHAPGTLEFMIDKVGIDQVVIGTDYSFPPSEDDPMGSLRSTHLKPHEIEQIAETNPRRLFPQLGARG